MKKVLSAIVKRDKYIFALLVIFIALSFIFTEITELNWLDNVVSITILLFIILSLPQLRGVIGIITYSLLLIGALLLIGNKNAFATVLEGSKTNLPLVVIFIVTPLLGIPINNGNYIEALKEKLVKVKNNATFFYISTTIITHALGFILNIGSVMINYYLTNTSNIRSPRLIANSLNRGFTTSIFWSPYFSAMALIITTLHIKWQNIGGPLFGFVVLSLSIGFLIELPFIKKEAKELKVQELRYINENKKGLHNKKLLELFLLILIVMGLVLLLEKFIFSNMVLSICIVAIAFPFIWSISKGKIILYKEEIKKHILQTIQNLRQEITLFFTAGLFSASYIESPISQKVVDFLNYFFGFSTIIMTLTISILIITTAIIGMHPIILVTVFATSINPTQIGFSEDYFAIVLLASWGLSNTISPATAVNNMLANILDRNILTVSLKWNWLYAIIMILILPFYLYILKILYFI